MSDENRVETDEERSLRRKKRIEEMKRKKRQVELFQKCVFPAVAVFLIVAMMLNVRGCTGIVDRQQEGMTPESAQDGRQNAGMQDGGQKTDGSDEAQGGVGGSGQNVGTQTGEVYGPFPTESPQPVVYQAFSTAATTGLPEGVISEYGVLIDVADNAILAQKGATERMNPASMTKVLTVLTAADALGIGGENWETAPVLNEKFTITIEITDYSYVHDCSNVGFEVGEEVTVRDLFYGTILPSGADAALGLAMYVAGTQEDFVALMNEKLEELGLSESTHITNCIGLYDEQHYSTVYDIGIILKTAADNPFCRAVLSAHTHNTAATAQHEEGLLISNWFLRRIEDRDTHGEVLCAKTGYVVQSKSCASSLAADADGREYICVTAGSTSSWTCIADHVLLYQTWLKSEESSAE